MTSNEVAKFFIKFALNGFHWKNERFGHLYKTCLKIIAATGCLDGLAVQQMTSMTRWLDIFFNIWPYARTKKCQNIIKVGQIMFKSLLNTN